MRFLLALLLGASAFDYKSISVKAPRRVVTDADIDAKFEEVDKPYALYPVDGPAEEGLCVLAEISLTSPNFEWKRDNYIVELLDDQAEPFAAVSTGICDAAVCAGQKVEFSFQASDPGSGHQPKEETHIPAVQIAGGKVKTHAGFRCVGS